MGGFRVGPAFFVFWAKGPHAPPRLKVCVRVIVLCFDISEIKNAI